ncbi:DNA-binding transcriptional LysR family regulator [Bradyrhizobium sp. GM5.1]
MFDVRVGHTRQVLGLVREGLVDIGIGYNPPFDPNLVVLKQWDEPLIGFVTCSHPLAKRSSVDLRELVEYPLILPPSRSPTRQIIDEASRNAGLAFKTQMESDSVGLRLAMAGRTTGVAVLARLSGRVSAQRGIVTAIPIDDPHLPMGKIATVAFGGRERSRAALAFLRLLRFARPSEIDGADSI